MSLQQLIANLKLCDSPQTLLQLENSLNGVGLTMQVGPTGKLFLCEINNGKPSNNTIFDDYIPVCLLTDQLDEDTRRRLMEFIISHASTPQKIGSTQDNGAFGLYGTTFHDGIREAETSKEIIAAISEWLDDV